MFYLEGLLAQPLLERFQDFYPTAFLPDSGNQPPLTLHFQGFSGPQGDHMGLLGEDLLGGSLRPIASLAIPKISCDFKNNLS